MQKLLRFLISPGEKRNPLMDVVFDAGSVLWKTSWIWNTISCHNAQRIWVSLCCGMNNEKETFPWKSHEKNGLIPVRINYVCLAENCLCKSYSVIKVITRHRIHMVAPKRIMIWNEWQDSIFSTAHTRGSKIKTTVSFSIPWNRNDVFELQLNHEV